MNSLIKDSTLETRVQSQPRDWMAVVIMRDGQEALLCMDVNLARLLERCIPMIHLRRPECVYTPEEILDIRSIVTRRRMYGRWEDATYEHFRLSDAKRMARGELKNRSKLIENNCTLNAVGAFVLLLAMILAPVSSFAQTIHWARCVPGQPREIWLHGRDLWSGNEYDPRTASATIDGVPLVWDRMTGANGHDANRALSFCHRFVVPDSLLSKASNLVFTRNDGATATASVNVLPVLSTVPMTSGRLRYLDSPIIVPPNGVYDGGGDVVTWNPPRTGPLVVVSPGAVVSNLTAFLPMGHDTPCVAILPGSGTILAGVGAINHSPKGVGLMLADGVQGAVVRDSRITASRCIECAPNARLSDNTFYRVYMSHIRGSNDGQCGRGFQGSRHLVAWCRWHDIDRGPTVAPWGSPNERCLWWECEQCDTGTSQGASEGLLFEAFECVHGPADVATDGTIDFATASSMHCKPGYFVIALASGKWSRIKTSVISPGAARLTTETTLPAGRYDIRVGNAFAENTVARCKFSNGRSGLWFFGAAIDNAVMQCDFRDLDNGIVSLDRRNAVGCALSIGLIDRYNQFRRCGVDRRVIP